MSVSVSVSMPAFATPLLDLAAEADAGAEALQHQGVVLATAVEDTRWSSAVARTQLDEALGLAGRLASAAARLAELADGFRALAVQGFTL